MTRHVCAKCGAEMVRLPSANWAGLVCPTCTPPTLAIDVATAVVAAQVVHDRLLKLRVRAVADARWVPEAARLEEALQTLHNAISGGSK